MTHLVDRPGQAVREGLELDVEQGQFLVGVQQVGQAVGVEADPAEDPVMGAVGDEPDQRSVGNGVRLEDVLRRRLEDQLQATGRRLHLHQRRVGEGAAGRYDP